VLQAVHWWWRRRGRLRWCGLVRHCVQCRPLLSLRLLLRRSLLCCRRLCLLLGSPLSMLRLVKLRRGLLCGEAGAGGRCGNDGVLWGTISCCCCGCSRLRRLHDVTRRCVEALPWRSSTSGGSACGDGGDRSRKPGRLPLSRGCSVRRVVSCCSSAGTALLPGGLATTIS